MAPKLKILVAGLRGSGTELINAIVGQELLPVCADGEAAVIASVVPQQVRDGGVPSLHAYHLPRAGGVPGWQQVAEGETAIREHIAWLHREAPERGLRAECRVSALLRDSLNVFVPPAAEWRDTYFIDIGGPAGLRDVGAQACADLACRVAQRLLFCIPTDLLLKDAARDFIAETRRRVPDLFDVGGAVLEQGFPVIFVVTGVDAAVGDSREELVQSLRSTVHAATFDIDGGSFSASAPVFCISARAASGGGPDWETFEGALTSLAGCKRDIISCVGSHRAARILRLLCSGLGTQGEWPHYVQHKADVLSALVGPLVARTELNELDLESLKSAAAAARGAALISAANEPPPPSSLVGMPVPQASDMGMHSAHVALEGMRRCDKPSKEGAFRDVIFYHESAVSACWDAATMLWDSATVARGSVLPVVLRNAVWSQNLGDFDGDIRCQAGVTVGQLWWIVPTGEGRVRLRNVDTRRDLDVKKVLFCGILLSAKESETAEWIVSPGRKRSIRLKHARTSAYLFQNQLAVGCYGTECPDQEWFVVPQVPLYIGDFVFETSGPSAEGKGQLFSSSGALLFSGRVSRARPVEGFIFDERSVCLGYFGFSPAGAATYVGESPEAVGAHLCMRCGQHDRIDISGTVLKPCSHGVVCDACAKELLSAKAPCPLCRTSVEGERVLVQRGTR